MIARKTTKVVDDVTAVNRRGPKSRHTDKFNEATFEAMLADMKSGRIPLNKVTFADDMQPGLRVIIRPTGNISYHVHYEIRKKSGTDRGMLKIGEYPDTTIERARRRAKSVITLGRKGVDPAEGLHDRMIRELDRDEERWRPELSPPAK